MDDWNADLTQIPKDGRWVLIIDEFQQPACVYWLIDDDGYVFGWTRDGGDRYEPTAWQDLANSEGLPFLRL